MIQLDRVSKAPVLQNGGDMLSFNPASHRCCQHDVAFGWPYFAECLWMGTPGNGLAACLYAANSVRARVGKGIEIRIVETTDYPFSEEILFRIDTPKPIAFPLHLRVPGWCRNAQVEVNGRDTAVSAKPGSWIVLERVWSDRDTARLKLPMEIGLCVWEKNQNSVSIRRGPLAYSLKIGERWERYGGTDRWPAYEVYPTTPWNYGLVLDGEDPASSFEIVRREGPPAAQPFSLEGAPIILRTTGKRIPQWQQEPNGAIGSLQESPVRSDERAEPITLIPMGCARLRVSAFPQIGKGPEAHAWQAQAVFPSASSSWIEHTPTALNDGILPKNSQDRDLPLFTWWRSPETPSGWVQYDFAEPRELSWCEVYWALDPAGTCRLPSAWKVLWKEGDRWLPVPGPLDYEILPDTFNRVTFDPVRTRAIRLETQFEGKHSAGILEWRVGK
jgi:hypothetical protein